MKQFKIACALLGILCGFTLSGCLDGGPGSGAPASSVSSTGNKSETASLIGASSSNGYSNTSGSGAINNTLHNSPKDTHSIITSFALWITKDDVNTAFAGEIIGNNITVQVPAETDLTVPLFITYTGSGYVELRTTDEHASLIPNNSSQYVSESQTFLGLKNGKAQTYNVLVIKRAPYFTFYDASHNCIKDYDGNIWASSTYPYPSQWGDIRDYATNFFTACNIPVGKWSIPPWGQAKSLLDKIPLAYRSKPDGPGNLEPADWLNISGFVLSTEQDYWTLEENKAISGNAYVMGFSKQRTGLYSDSKMSYSYYALPVSSGPESSAKTIIDLTFTPESGTPSKGTIVGNQIFVTTTVWANPGTAVNANIIISTTGGTVSYNGRLITADTGLAYNVSQPIPLTVTTKNANADKNIYTLFVKTTLPTPPKKPEVPGLITVCSSSGTDDPDKKFNRIIATTVGNNFYQNYLPLPGTCSQLNIGNTNIADLAAHKVIWYSFFNENPIASTSYVDQSGYYHDIIPKFLWIPADPRKPDPSGFWLYVTMDPSCHHDSQYPSGVTPSCTN